MKNEDFPAGSSRDNFMAESVRYSRTSVLNTATVAWLLEPENPSVRYFTLTGLLRRPPDDPDVLQARAAIMASGPVPDILERQNRDGSWGDPMQFYGDKYKGAAWTLLLLAELGADPSHPQVRRACEFILEHAQSPGPGGFAHLASERDGHGLPGAVIPCLTGNMTYALIRLGCLEDDRVRQAIDWITTWQRADDGDAPPPDNPYYKRYEPCFGRHTCHMGVAKAMKAFAAIPAERRSAAVNGRLAEFAEYFLKHHVYRRSHNLAEVSRPGWLRLGFPLMYQTDILELAGILTAIGIRDSRLDDALGVIAGKCGPDGRWLMENTFNGKMLVRIEQKGRPSKWITLKALGVLDAQSRDMALAPIQS